MVAFLVGTRNAGRKPLFLRHLPTNNGPLSGFDLSPAEFMERCKLYFLHIFQWLIRTSGEASPRKR